MFGQKNPFDCICQVIVLLPNNNRIQVCCKPDATVRTIHETVVTYVDLIEHNLFSLAILIGKYRSHSSSFIFNDGLDVEYFFPSMDTKISKLAADSKWKLAQATFTMQLKIKYFVTDIAILRWVRRTFDWEGTMHTIILLLILDTFWRNISSICNSDRWSLRIPFN